MSARHVSPPHNPATRQRRNAALYGAIVGGAMCAVIALGAPVWAWLAAFLAASALAAAVCR